MDADIDTDPAATFQAKATFARQVNGIFFKRPKCGQKRDRHCPMIEDISLLLLVLMLNICIVLR